jgi:hypothetical protein
MVDCLWFVGESFIEGLDQLQAVAKIDLWLPCICRIWITNPFYEVRSLGPNHLRIDNLLCLPLLCSILQLIVVCLNWFGTVRLPSTSGALEPVSLSHTLREIDGTPYLIAAARSQWPLRLICLTHLLHFGSHTLSLHHTSAKFDKQTIACVRTHTLGSCGSASFSARTRGGLCNFRILHSCLSRSAGLAALGSCWGAK